MATPTLWHIYACDKHRGSVTVPELDESLMVVGRNQFPLDEGALPHPCDYVGLRPCTKEATTEYVIQVAPKPLSPQRFFGAR